MAHADAQTLDEEGGLGLTDLPWESAMATGALYFLGALTAMFFLFLGDLALSTGDQYGYGSATFGGGKFTMWGWIFYNAHVVPIVDASSGNGLDILAQFSAVNTVPRVVYYLVPPYFMARAGQSVVEKNAPDGLPPLDGAKVGAAIAAGYLPLAVGGRWLFTYGGVGPGFFRTVLLAGLLLPLVFGAVGGYFATR